MNSRVVTAALVSIACIFTSCAEKNDTRPKKDIGTAQPQELDFAKPTPGTKLTQSQIKEIKAIFSQKPSIEIAASELLLTDRDSKLDQNEQVEQYLKEQSFKATANPQSWALYQSMRASCQKQQGAILFEATFPTERVIQASDLTAGDHLTTSVGGAYGGTNCDVETSAKMGYSMKVESIDKDGVASGEASMSLKALMKNPKYAALLKSKGIVLSTAVSAVVAKQNVNSKEISGSSGSLRFNLNGSYYTQNNEIPAVTTYSIFARALDETTAEIQVEAVLMIQMPTFSTKVIAHLKDLSVKNSNTQKMEETYYVNGHEMSKEEINELIGNTLSNPKATAVKEMFLN